MSNKIKAGITGATGCTGARLFGLLYILKNDEFFSTNFPIIKEKIL